MTESIGVWPPPPPARASEPPREIAPVVPRAEPLRLGVFGASIVEGLGVGPARWPQVLGELLGAELIDYSHTGFTASHYLSRYRAHPRAVDLMIVACGGAEPMPRLHPWVRDQLPRRWRPLGWMDPRPFHSARRRRRLLEQVESGVRWRLQRLLRGLTGSRVLMSSAEYVAALESLLALIRRDSPDAVVVLLHTGHASHPSFRAARRGIDAYERAARRIPGQVSLSSRSFLEPVDDYLLDRFHPNAVGHQRIALGLLPLVERLLAQRDGGRSR